PWSQVCVICVACEAKLEADHLRQVEPPFLAQCMAVAVLWTVWRRPAIQLAGFRCNGSQHIRDRKLASPDDSQSILDRSLPETRQHLLQFLVAVLDTDPLEPGDQQSPAQLRVLTPKRIPRSAANGRPRPASYCNPLPGRRRRLAGGGQDVHLVAIA